MTETRPRRQIAPGARRRVLAQRPRSVPWSAAFAPSPDVTTSIQDREALLLNRASGMQYTLNAVGTATWELLDGRRPLAAVLGALAEQFDAPEAQLRRDLLALVRVLRAEGLIQERR